jgi:hypothetical protein
MEQPRTFKSDQAFNYQLARRVRSLSNVNAGEYWDNNTKKTKRVYRDIPPKTLSVLAEYLKDIFG